MVYRGLDPLEDCCGPMNVVCPRRPCIKGKGEGEEEAPKGGSGGKAEKVRSAHPRDQEGILPERHVVDISTVRSVHQNELSQQCDGQARKQEGMWDLFAPN